MPNTQGERQGMLRDLVYLQATQISALRSPGTQANSDRGASLCICLHQLPHWLPWDPHLLGVPMSKGCWFQHFRGGYAYGLTLALFAKPYPCPRALDPQRLCAGGGVCPLTAALSLCTQGNMEPEMSKGLSRSLSREMADMGSKPGFMTFYPGLFPPPLRGWEDSSLSWLSFPADCSVPSPGMI